MTATTTRNAGLEDLVTMLREQHTRKIDMVVNADSIKMIDGNITVGGVDPILTEDGVDDPNGTYVPTPVADEGIAEKLRIPLGYLRRMREDRVDLLDANVNGWLHGRRPKVRKVVTDGVGRDEVIREAIPGDQRKFLLRTFRGDDGGPGIARALLSDSYSVMDNLDVLMAVLNGIHQSGAEVDISQCDLTERRMHVKIVAPQIAAIAPELLRNYRSPFSGASGAENPTVFAGFAVSNSEVGNGAFSIVPRLVVKVCNNGMTITKDAMRAVHLGSRLDEGVIRWSKDTEEKNIALITAKARDAVSTFLDIDYLRKVVADIEAKATAEVTSTDQVEVVTKALKYTEAQQDLVLQHFSKAGSWTRGGIAGAVTSAAQEIEDADVAADMEADAVKVLDMTLASV